MQNSKVNLIKIKFQKQQAKISWININNYFLIKLHTCQHVYFENRTTIFMMSLKTHNIENIYNVKWNMVFRNNIYTIFYYTF